MSNPDKGQKTTFSTTTFGFGPEKISYVIWNFGDGAMSKGQSLSTTHTYTLAGTKTVTQNIMLTNGQQMTNIITLYIVDKANFLSYALLSLPNVLIGNRGQQISFTNYIVGDKSRTPLLYLRQSDPDHTQQLSGANKLPFTTSQSYQSNSIYHPQTTAFINQCEQLQSSTTLTIHGNDMCLEAKIGNTLKKAYHCDLDRDSIPDMCDEDIDNDGKPNLLGIITSENASCTYGPDNTNNDVLSKHFKHICSLDNAPFTSNKEQLDLDGDGMGDVDSGFQNLDIINDGDQDGIIDAQDLCPSIHGM